MSTNHCWSGLSSMLECGNRSPTCTGFPRAGRESTPLLREADQGNATQGSQTPRGNRLGRATGVSQHENPDAPTEGAHSHDLRAEAPVIRTKAWDWDLGLPIVGRGADSRQLALSGTEGRWWKMPLVRYLSKGAPSGC